MSPPGLGRRWSGGVPKASLKQTIARGRRPSGELVIRASPPGAHRFYFRKIHACADDSGTTPVGAACRPWHSPGVRWNEEKSRRFQVLRAAEVRGTLTGSERAELALLLEDLDADEADALRPAMEQASARAGDLAAEKAELEAQADALARIVAEQEGLLVDAAAYLQKLREKSAALAEDYRRLMGHDLAPAR